MRMKSCHKNNLNITGKSASKKIHFIESLIVFISLSDSINIQETNYPIFDGLVGYAIKYFNDVIKSQKKYKTPSDDEKKALEALIVTLEKCNDQMPPEEIQTLIYSTGKENGYAENLRDWFKLIYEVVFGDENGPRMGFFISFFGVNETKDLIMSKLK